MLENALTTPKFPFILFAVSFIIFNVNTIFRIEFDQYTYNNHRKILEIKLSIITEEIISIKDNIMRIEKEINKEVDINSNIL